jgi:hypothetical protein
MLTQVLPADQAGQAYPPSGPGTYFEDAVADHYT